MKKKLLVVVLLLLFMYSFVSCNSIDKDKKQYTIGIGQFAEHPSLDNCRKGFMQGLKDEGFNEGENVVFSYENAQTDGSFANQIFSNFVNSKKDLIVAIATPMAQAAYSSARDTDIPVIFSAVTDPVAAELANENKMPVGNITGTSDKLPVEEQLKLIRQMYKDAKKVGILYTTSEVNSLSSIEEYKYYASKYDFDIVVQGINEVSDMSLACDNILSKVDVMTNVTDNTVVASLPILIEKAKSRNIPVFGSEIEQVKNGCVACMGLDYIELGKQTGRMAAKILKGQSKASDMPYEIIENASLYINKRVADDLSLSIDKDLLDSASQVFTE